MPFPEGLPLVTLVCQFDTPPDGAAFGSVRITSPQPLQGPDDDSIVPVIDQVVRLDPVAGSATFRLPPVTVDGWTPENWAYSVTAAVNGLTPIRGTVQLFVDDTTVNLADRLILTSSVIVPGVTYATLAQLNAGLATKSDIGHTHASGDHTHTIDQVLDLQVQLDGKLDVPVEPYITAADIDHLISAEAVAEGYLPKTSPVATTATMLGLTEFGSTELAAEQRIDSRAGQGVAYLGAKNGAANLGISGFVDVDGPPVSGTWAVNDLVITRTGAFRCTVAGTPGTWSGNSSGKLSLIEVAAAPTPVPDQIQLYALDLQTNSVPRMMLPEGIEIDPIRDTVFVVRNASGSSITKGTAVYASGIHPGAGLIPTVAPAQANAAATAGVVGIMIETVANNSYGRLMVQGRIDGMNTSGLTAGLPLYLSASTPGALTTTAPAHPDFTIGLGVTLRSNASDGAIAVNLGQLQGNLAGTAQNTFSIGSNTAGTKVVRFRNGFDGSLSAAPTAARTWTLPDQSGTLGLSTYQDITTAPTTGTYAVGDIVDTRVGRFRCTVAGTPGTWMWLQASTAVDHGFCGWMGDPADIQAGLIIASGGTPLIFRFRADQPTVSAMNLHLSSPGTLLTNAYWTLHNDAGDILGAGAKSADQSTNLQTGGERTMPLNVAQAVTPGAFYRARFWVTTSGGALPTVSRRCNSSNAAINAGGQLWYSTAAGGLTTAAAAPDAIGTLLTTLTTAYWAGWKA